jgi:hypothetical protein
MVSPLLVRWAYPSARQGLRIFFTAGMMLVSIIVVRVVGPRAIAAQRKSKAVLLG